MKAIFNRNCILVGWYDQQRNNVFSREMVWIGFVYNGHFFNTYGQWLGGFIRGTYVDRTGKPVAWIEGHAPVGVNVLVSPTMPSIPMMPLPPIRPLMPLMPLRPLTPFGGWSSLDWNEYIRS